jgi:organic hydroperoxide reductase OsmC/OhrA
MNKTHNYPVTITWTGNQGEGTTDYTVYKRDHTISVEGKADMHCSADTIFRGDGTKYNPEDLLVSSIATCHMLWYLHLCADAGINVIEYRDEAVGTLELSDTAPGKFTQVTLHPHVVVAEATMIDLAISLHEKAHEKCFISNSCNFPIQHKVHCTTKQI